MWLQHLWPCFSLQVRSRSKLNAMLCFIFMSQGCLQLLHFVPCCCVVFATWFFLDSRSTHLEVVCLPFLRRKHQLDRLVGITTCSAEESSRHDHDGREELQALLVGLLLVLVKNPPRVDLDRQQKKPFKTILKTPQQIWTHQWPLLGSFCLEYSKF